MVFFEKDWEFFNWSSKSHKSFYIYCYYYRRNYLYIWLFFLNASAYAGLLCKLNKNKFFWFWILRLIYSKYIFRKWSHNLTFSKSIWSSFLKDKMVSLENELIKKFLALSTRAFGPHIAWKTAQIMCPESKKLREVWIIFFIDWLMEEQQNNQFENSCWSCITFELIQKSIIKNLY